MKLKVISLYIFNVFIVCNFYGCKVLEDSTKIAKESEKALEIKQQLYKKLVAISKKGIAIGHQDDTSYGLGWNHKNNPKITKSDVEIVTGDFPAVFGFDLGWIEIDKPYNLDTVPFQSMKKLIIDAHKKGGIITISWHANNPVSGGSSWDKTSAVSQIIKGGIEREKYEVWVSKVAAFIKDLKYQNKPIPIIFRPFHEMNGSWFWWGGENCKPEDYKILWRETVDLLKNKHKIHSLLYAFSPNKLGKNDQYLDYYPGDEYVDILGMDIYDFNDSEEYMKSVKHDLAILKEIATQKNKLYAFTETGLESLKTKNWFTKVLYPSIENTGICWVLTWRNYDTKHHYMPYKGHLNELDFIEFEKLPKTLFLKDINSLN
ncbi:glycoside hydrolase family 26 protein [Lutibacter sp.]|uniref:glycoside hydrolase family 26 protein n=1 Tax=Lutibacter sp. TaxID=1925666 RepID=UPI00356932BF